jgi:hypothetical protein
VEPPRLDSTAPAPPLERRRALLITRSIRTRATTYQLVPVRQLDFGRAERIFDSWPDR